jgi:PAS domain S-box-containing protein
MMKKNGRSGTPDRKIRIAPGANGSGRRNGSPADWSAGEGLFRSMADASSLMVWMCGPDGLMTYFSSRWLEFTGRSRAKEVGSGWTAGLHPEDAGSGLKTFHAAVGARQPFRIEWRLRHADGTYHWVFFSGSPRLVGRRFAGYVGTAMDITLRRHNQEALRESTSRYRGLAESIGDVFCAMDGNSRFIYWNKACEQLTGRSTTDVVGRSLYDVFPESQGSDIDVLFRTVTASGRPGSLELEFPGKDRTIPLEIFVYPAQSGLSVIAKDITTRRNAERALRASEEKYRSIFEHANDAILIVEPRTEKVLEANGKALQLYGFTREEFVGMSLKKVTMDIAREEQQIEQTLQGGMSTDFETVQFRKDGTPLTLMVNASVIDYHGQPAILSINRDASRLHTAEEVLGSEDNLLRRLLASTDDIVFMQDKEGRYLFYNGSPRYGLTFEQVHGKTPYDFHAPQTARKMMERLYRVIATGRSVSGEMKWDWHGEQVWFLDQSSPVRNAAGEVTSVVTISRNITERKRAEERLRCSEERYRAFIEQSADGIWRFESVRPIPVSLSEDEQIEQIFRYGYLAECNEAMVRMLGQQRAEGILGAPIGSLIARESVQNIVHLRAFIRSGYRLTEAESREVDSRGTIRYLLNTFVGIVEEGCLVRAWGSRRDVTERTQVERQMRLLGQTITSTRDCVSITDLEHRILFVNDAFLSTYGYAEEEIIGKPVAILQSRAGAEGETDRIGPATLSDGSYAEVLHRRKDGAELPLEVWTSVVRNDEGEPVALVGVARDITERKRMEDALRQSEARLRRITDTMRDVVTQTDAAGVVQYATPSVEQVLGYRLEEILGKTIFDRIHAEDVQKVREAFQTATRDRTGGRLEFRYCHADGQILWLESVGNLLFDDQGSVTGAVFGTRDITSRKRVEEQIKASLQEKEVLLKEIHHRVKNNLQVISSLLSLQSEYLQDEELRKVLKESQNRVKSMAIIHQRLYQSGNLAEIDFASYIQELCSQLLRSYGAPSRKISLNVQADEVALGVDRAIPCGIILNELISNALKYAFPGNDGGTVTVRLRALEHAVELSVNDDGVGLPAGLDVHTNNSLGLKLVNMLVEQLGGTIAMGADETRSEPRRGVVCALTFKR